MRPLFLALTFTAATSLSCGLFSDASDRLDSSRAEEVCEASCNRQVECDDQFDVDTCRNNCGASVAAWYLCPDAPEIAEYIETCNEMACDEVSTCLEGRPEC